MEGHASLMQPIGRSRRVVVGMPLRRDPNVAVAIFAARLARWRHPSPPKL
jgi:hypothetical protein